MKINLLIIIASIFIASIFFQNAYCQKVSFITSDNPFRFDLQYETFPLNPETCGTFMSNSGSSICVPPQALERVDGKKMSEEITLYYKEFHRTEDIVAAGISMKVNVDGKIKWLETVGMFEIQAFDGEIPLKIKAGKYITVRMGSQNPSSKGVNYYTYDAKSKIWQTVPDAKPMIEQPGPDDVKSILSIDPESDYYDDKYASYAKNSELFYFNNAISNFGLHNYDYIHNVTDPIMITASFTSEEIEKRDKKAYVIYEGNNTAIYFGESNLKSEFYIESGKKFKILWITSETLVNEKEKKLTEKATAGIFIPEEHNFNPSQYKNKSYTFKTKKLEINTPEDLKFALTF